MKTMNAVDTPTLFSTINAVSRQPELAQLTFRASSTWVGGTHSRSRAEVFDDAEALAEQLLDHLWVGRWAARAWNAR